ncbi:MAG: T9SS type A sorting domain-containing protein, partial [Bacteroidales bacterium]|nr:T9SS type A sorting domain-containing protein [Bacteroidales bacterium]
NDTCEFISYQILYVSQDTSGGGNDSTYCQNDFEYTVQDMMVSVNGWGFGDIEVAFYYWSFGDGESAEGQSMTHEYASTGDYQITLTTISYIGCEAITTKTVSIGGSGSQDMLYGTVTIGDAFLDFGIASLYSIYNDTVGGDDFELVAEASIDSSGSYFFNNVPQGNYLILVQPATSSIYFDNTLPTYYGDVIYWVNATIIVLGDPVNPYDIGLQPSAGSNAGEAQINGDIIGEGFKQLLIDENVNIFLLDENNTPLEIVYSEIDESFDFSNIAFGDYVVYAEVIGLPTNPAIVSLSAENPTANIEILISPNGVTTGIDDELAIQIKGGIYPNPVVSHAQLEINLKENTNIQMTIVNQIGQVVKSKSEFMTQGINKLEINTQSYPPGVYLLQIRTANSAVNQRFIKK